MLRNCNRSSGGRRVLGTWNVGIIASQIISETATGDQGPGLLYDDALVQTGKQLRAKITSYSGTAGKLFVFENGSILVEGESNGLFSIGYDVYGDNVFIKSDTASVQVGPLDASAGSGTGTSTGSGIGGSATGGTGSAGSASSGTGTSTGSGSGGDATGGASGAANATAGTGVSIGSGSGGGAVGQHPGEASGGTGTSTGSGYGGNAGDVQLTSHPKFIIKAAKRLYTIIR